MRRMASGVMHCKKMPLEVELRAQIYLISGVFALLIVYRFVVYRRVYTNVLKNNKNNLLVPSVVNLFKLKYLVKNVTNKFHIVFIALMGRGGFYVIYITYDGLTNNIKGTVRQETRSFVSLILLDTNKPNLNQQPF